MAIYLIRHGETAGNRNRVVQVPSTPLSDRGLAQAALLATRLADAGIRRILCSDQARAAMTAAPLSDRIGVSVEHDPDLAERNFGDHRGTPYAELADRGIDLFGPGYAPPGGEGWPGFHERVDRAWGKVEQAAAGLTGNLAVVTHGLVCHSLTVRRLEVPGVSDAAGHDGPPIRFGNTSVTVLEGPRPWRAVRFACTEHLDGETADDGSALSGI